MHEFAGWYTGPSMHVRVASPQSPGPAPSRCSRCRPHSRTPCRSPDSRAAQTTLLAQRGDRVHHRIGAAAEHHFAGLHFAARDQIVEQRSHHAVETVAAIVGRRKHARRPARHLSPDNAARNCGHQIAGAGCAPAPCIRAPAAGRARGQRRPPHRSGCRDRAGTADPAGR